MRVKYKALYLEAEAELKVVKRELINLVEFHNLAWWDRLGKRIGTWVTKKR